MNPEFYAALFNETPIPIALWSISPDLGESTLAAANKASKEQYREQWGLEMPIAQPAREAWTELLERDSEGSSFIGTLWGVADSGEAVQLMVPYAPAGRPERLYRCDVYRVGPGHVAVSYIDVTAERRRQFELEWFASAASHDLLSPLRTINNWLERLQRYYLHADAAPWDERAERWLGFVTTGVERMESTTTGLLEYVRGPGPDEAPSRTDLGAALAEAISELHIAGSVHVESELPAVRGVWTPIVLVFRNLLQNAVKYAQPGQELEVRVRAVTDDPELEGLACVAVTDNGIGVPAEYTETVFEPLRRLHRHDQIPGSGLGLATCRRVVDRHEGRIWLTSDGQGQGATIYLALPLWEADGG